MLEDLGYVQVYALLHKILCGILKGDSTELLFKIPYAKHANIQREWTLVLIHLFIHTQRSLFE